MRVRFLLITCLLSALSAPASAQGLKLAWDNCASAGGLHTMMFDCNTNSDAQAHTLVASFIAPAGVGQYVSNQSTIYVTTGGPALPDWWKIKGTGQCRSVGAVGSGTFTSGPFGCTDAWGVAASGALASYNVGFISADRGRMNLVFAVPPSNAVALVEGVEYYAFKVTILNTKTIGVGSCGGCTTPVVLQLNNMQVQQPSGAPGGNKILEALYYWYDYNQSEAGWQCPVAYVSHACPYIECYPAPEPNCATPVRRSTWGAIKAIYH